MLFNKSPDIYNKLKKMENNHINQINLDVVRTNNEEPLFQIGNENCLQDNLKNILIAYSNFDKEVGYVQGMNYIVSALLYNLHYSKYKDIEYSFGRKNKNFEELSFWIFVYIFNVINWRSCFTDKFPKLYSICETLNLKIKEEFYDLYIKFKEKQIDSFYIFGNKILSIILYKIPIKYSTLIIDIFLLEEEKIIFELILRLIDLNYSKIHSLNSKEELMMYFSNNFFRESFEENKDNLKIILPYPLIENII